MTEYQKELFLQEYISITGDNTIQQRVQQKEPLYLLRLCTYITNALYDYRAGKLPEEIVKGREKNFERYERILLVIINSLHRAL